MGGPQPSGPAARPTLQAPAHQSTAQVRGRVPRVHGDRGMGRRLGSRGPRPCAAPRAEPTEDRSPTWQVSHVPQGPAPPSARRARDGPRIDTHHLRGFAPATAARLSGACAVGPALGSPAASPPPCSTTSTCPRGTLHFSRYRRLPAARALLSCAVLERSTGDRHSAAANGEVVAPSSRGPAAPSLCGTGDRRSHEHLTPEALRGAEAVMPGPGSSRRRGQSLAGSPPPRSPPAVWPGLGASLGCPGESRRKPASQRPALHTSRPHSLRDARANTGAPAPVRAPLLTPPRR